MLQSSTKTIEKDFRIILGATVVGSPKALTFKDETTFKAQHRRDEASGGASGPVGQWGGLHGPTAVLTTSGCMLTLWQNDTQRQKRTEPKCSVIVIMQAQSKNIYLKKKRSRDYTVYDQHSADRGLHVHKQHQRQQFLWCCA